MTDDDTGGGTPAQGAKRRQILAGARDIFLARGFDGASMETIARHAGVSKGTLYVYFTNKEALFIELVGASKRAAVERLVAIESEDPDLARALTDFASELLLLTTDAEHLRFLRMVIGVADRFPDLGRRFFEAGPAYGAGQLRRWLETQQARGRIRVPDAEMAAWQFLGLVIQPVMTAVLMSARTPPDPAEARQIAGRAVTAFLGMYGA